MLQILLLLLLLLLPLLLGRAVLGLPAQPVFDFLCRASKNNSGHLQKKLRKNPQGVGMKKEEEKAVWKKLVYPIWRVL